ncbi:MAG TPA: diacylglycerol kinase family protein [Thermoleophilaceae bacterium]
MSAGEPRGQAAGAQPDDEPRGGAAPAARRFALLVNPASAGGRALKALPNVHATLDELGARHRTVTTRSINHAYEEAGTAAAEGETVVALGGDGLLRPIAGALKGTDSAVAIVPCGRGNDFARVLGVPKDPAEAARLAVVGGERLVDVANVEGTPFVGIASVGFDSDCNRIANEAKLIKGNAVYVYAALRTLASWKPAGFTVTVDGERHEFSGYSVAVGNSRAYGGGMFILPQAELDDGKLDLMLAKDCPRLRFLSGVIKTFKAAHTDSEFAEFLRGEEIEVSSDRPFAIYADGDPIAATPAMIRVERRCLRVVAPA